MFIGYHGVDLQENVRRVSSPAFHTSSLFSACARRKPAGRIPTRGGIPPQEGVQERLLSQVVRGREGEEKGKGERAGPVGEKPYLSPRTAVPSGRNAWTRLVGPRTTTTSSR